MPEKQIDNYLVFAIFLVSALGALGNALAEEECFTHTSIKHLLIQMFIGGISGIIFGFFACWLFDNQWASLAVAGSGSILGIKGARSLANIVMKKLEKTIK